MKRVLLAHGDGGLYAAALIKDLFLRHFRHAELGRLSDAALLSPVDGRLAVTTDSFVVQPPFFPGGDIGKLSVCGTVNDLLAGGAQPLYLAVSFILEEGLLLDELEAVVVSLADTARSCGVEVVAGDTKVVPRGQADKLYITTTGIGRADERLLLGAEHVRPGDAVILSGTAGDHGIAVLSCRTGVSFQTQVVSDCAPLNGLIYAISPYFSSLRWLRDPTRGGVGATLNELAERAVLDIVLEEKSLPVRPEVRAAAELLGLDPLYLPNEGKMILVAKQEAAAEVCLALREHPLGREAEIIGHLERGTGSVWLRTVLGGTRGVEMPAGLPLPRIC
ncbi:MAG: hydrogenase expression/formation protein HypE [Dethiobacter sp.]|jgi:hydrogenase expression/formation protein HypE|nr:hydrogenase expression/formation protein HypE [Dethiobacter sp.]MBS3900894.1 hydrogenase expression/formation protein HypE [Dethiobacter sp.]MBS3988428.1 hydrogenase expression/formation protein HypE [Dethiobacter sp.]